MTSTPAATTRSRPARAIASIPLIPAHAGTQGHKLEPAYLALDSRVRGNERSRLSAAIRRRPNVSTTARLRKPVGLAAHRPDAERVLARNLDVLGQPMD